ncbi:MAG TPA: ketoacyl-ACP synthase III [Polyangiaceae bacterium]|nr:ketoacyl-ACP synthase III [Polyangiaceae bacterium]
MLHLHGLGHFHPENVLDNAFFESLDIGTTEEWILTRVGIHTRRTVLPLDYLRQTKNADPRAAEEAARYTNAQTGAKAAEMALERAGVTKGDVGLVIAGGCSPRWSIPAESSLVAKELGIEVPAFDMHAACSTFGLHLHYLSTMGEALPDYVLCLCIENNTRVIDYRDRSSCVLWGDGTTAAVISTKHPGRAEMVSSSFGGSPAGALDVTVPRYGFFAQNGSKVQKFAIKRMLSLLKESQAGSASPDELVYVGHQANLTMLESVARRGKIGEGRHWFNIDHFGNQGSAGAPAVISQRWDEIPAGTEIATVVVGSGLSWSRLRLRFN